MRYPQFRQADTGKRVVGYLIDLVGVLICSFIVGLAFGVLTVSAQITDADSVDKALGYIAIGLYFGGFWALRGQTPGQQLLGIHVVRRDNPQLGGVGFGTALARCFGYVVCWLTLGIGFFFDLHDKIASTQAVEVAWVNGPVIALDREEI